MKQLVTAGLSLMLGVGIGAGAVLTSSRLRAQSQVDDGAARLVITPAAALSGRWVTTGPMTWLGKTPQFSSSRIRRAAVAGLGTSATTASSFRSPWRPRQPATRRPYFARRFFFPVAFLRSTTAELVLATCDLSWAEAK